MNACVFCLMLARQRLRLEEPLSLVLTKDQDGRAYFQIDIPVCKAHSAIPGIFERVEGLLPGTSGTPQAPKLYEASLFVSCEASSPSSSSSLPLSPSLEALWRQVNEKEALIENLQSKLQRCEDDYQQLLLSRNLPGEPGET